MRHSIALCLTLLLAQPSLYSQTLYTPRNIQEAYKKGTRSPDGRPGPNYWQNKGRYTINITAAPPDRTIRGDEHITYINNSPDTLRAPVIKLILNIHKPGAVRYGLADSTYLTNGIVIDAFSQNGQARPFPSSGAVPTWRPFRLDKPLAPHDSVELTFKWHYQISLESNREGMIDSTTYFLAYFYPRVAVYDDYNGWDRLDFTDQQEFYNDFNDYTLTVTAPKNYIVWATGTLQNPDAVLQPAYAKKLAASMTTDEILHIATKEDLAKQRVTRQNPTNSWVWTANDITDVTANVSDHYVWDASSVIVDDATKRRASVQSAFNDTAKDFHRMVEFGRHALDWLSHKWPGVPYPFPKTTIVQGYADMEYPMMVNDGTNEDPIFSRFVAEHEIAHSWFPFYMGINEARYAFMDEGWATTFELLIGREDLGTERAEGFYKQFRVNGYIYDPSQEEDLPIITPANVLRNAAYGNNAYGKPSLAYLAVKDMLGDDLFRKCLHEYMARWHGKHPIPWDFFYTFNDVAGKNMNWFWTNWFFTNNYIDLAIDKVEGNNVFVTNIGGFAIPFDVVFHYTDGSSDTRHQTPAIWAANEKQAQINIAPAGGKKLLSVELKGGIYVDADISNNSWKAPQ
ncbi:MAG: aminopeptidase [Sphingobacteriales bacterium 50-39]|nr:M1 family metallopeptidase [Sphingobacteriales bacterium]OJW54250.1 MAG: aminopeptidase [Sphingobacteriales bacterium 50-39]